MADRTLPGLRVPLDEMKRKIRADLPPEVSDETSDAIAVVIDAAGRRITEEEPSEKRTSETSVFDLIGNARVVFWCCDDCDRSLVTWTKHDDGTQTPRCESCGKEGGRR